MKVWYILLVLTTVFISCAQSQRKMGECTSEEYLRGAQSCQIPLVQDLQKNPKSDCSAEMTKYLDCAAKKMKICYPKFEISMLKAMLQKSLTKDLLCNKAGLRFPTPSPVNGTFPCKMDPTEYHKGVTKCSEKLLKMWQANRADKGTCGEFQNTKQCLVKLSKDAQCQLTEEAKKQEKLMYGAYNPFCPKGVDAKPNPTAIQPKFNSKRKRGECSNEEYLRGAQSCQILLVQDLQKNPKSDCSDEMTKYFDCAAKGMKICYPKVEISLLKASLQTSLTKDLLCNKASLQFPTPSPVNGTFPCKMDPAEYQKDVTKCSEKLLKMWQANRADKGTCGEFENTKQCLVKLSKDAQCQLTEEAKKEEKLMYGAYNPFCPKGVNVKPNQQPNSVSTLKGGSTIFLLALLVWNFIPF